MPRSARRASSTGSTSASIRPDMILIGEPTSVDRLGDTVKIGRRGSVNMWIDVPGIQGHVAYPHLSPTIRWRRSHGSSPRSTRSISTTAPTRSRPRTSSSPESRLRPRPATSSPASATAQLNIRFNNLHRGDDLVAHGRGSRRARGAGRHGPRAHLGRGVPDPAGAAVRRRGGGDRGGDRHRARHCRPAAARRTAGSSSSFARWSISACPTRRCTRSTNSASGRGYRSAVANLRADRARRSFG